MTTEYRVVGSTAAASFGPTKNEKTARGLLDGRRAQYGDSHPWGPWRLQKRTITEWQDVTGTLWEATDE